MSFSIQLQSLSLRYHQELLFENLSFELPAGQCVVLLGPSGVGKSSLLHRIAHIKLDKRHQFTGNIMSSDHQPLGGRVMLMTQQDGLLPWLNGMDNVLIGFQLRNEISARQQERAESMLLIAGLSSQDFCKKPGELSGGMRQRIALVRTLMEDKPLLLLDEPFSALDAITRYKLQETAAQMWRGKTVLLVTHDPFEALRLADQIYVMRGKPAKLEKITVPHGLPPRHITAEFTEYQAKILELLKI